MNDLLNTAFEEHQAGRNANAARAYDALLREQPDHPDALHLFGLLHYQTGYYERAVELMSRAVAFRPDAAAYHANLAEAKRALGKKEEAAEHCRSALRLQPNYPEAANNLGLALHDLERYPEAIEQFRAALQMSAGESGRPANGDVKIWALAQNNLGTSLQELPISAGESAQEEATKAFRKAVEFDPQLAMARANLAQALVNEGKAWEALEHCRYAIWLEPNLAVAHNSLGNVFRALERYDEAKAAYAEALRLDPELSKVQTNLGLTAQAEGRLDEALACFRRAVELMPDDAEGWENLARAHMTNEDAAAAIPCRERVVALEPEGSSGSAFDFAAKSKADNLGRLGFAYQEECRMDEASACYARGLALDPNNLEVLMNQGTLHEELGAMAEAEVCFRQAWQAHPAAPFPLVRLAALLRGKLPQADRLALRLALYDRRPNEAASAGLLFGLAHVCDATGDYAEAAGCLKIANKAASEIRRRENRPYDAAAHRQYVDMLLESFTPELFERLARAGDDSRKLVFVFGMPRSGTTLVEQVLAGHSRVHGAGELRLARATFDSIPRLLGVKSSETVAKCLAAMTPTADDTAAPAIWRQLAMNHASQLEVLLQTRHVKTAPDRVVDKMPDNYLYAGLLALVFPRATFIHVRRDLRDIAVSCWMTNFTSIRWADDFEHLAGRIREYRRLMAHWQAVLPVPVHEVVYEQLVDDFETEARRLVAACGLEWEPGCLQFHASTRPVRTASVTQVRQPLYRRSLARWKHYETELAELFALLPDQETRTKGSLL